MANISFEEVTKRFADGKPLEIVADLVRLYLFDPGIETIW